jgi:tripartite-type tricarboxylate transporter receptor subunit TctC
MAERRTLGPWQAFLYVAGAILWAVPNFACAQQKFPAKPVRLVGPAAGNIADTVSRTIGPRLAEGWRQPVIIENRAGAGGTLAAATVAKAAPDGHTMLLISGQFALGAVLQPNLPYQVLKDFVGVSQIGYSTSVLVVAPATAKSVKELVALAQAQPGKLIFSSGGAGSNNHMTAEQFGFNAGIKAVHVGFKSGSEALIEVLAGRAHYCMASVAAALPMIRDGRLQALGVTTPARSPLLPNVPAIVEVLPGFSRDASFGLFAPAGTPLSIRWQIGRDVARALDQPDVRDRLQGMAFAPVSSTPEELDKILREQVATFTALAQKVGLRTK